MPAIIEASEWPGPFRLGGLLTGGYFKELGTGTGLVTPRCLYVAEPQSPTELVLSSPEGGGVLEEGQPLQG